MTIIKDPEGHEATVLNAMANFQNHRVLEIGCGDGRLTWRLADNAAFVMALDPNADDIEKAKGNTPERSREKVSFLPSTLEDFVASYTGAKFNSAIFSWSL